MGRRRRSLDRASRPLAIDARGPGIGPFASRRNSPILLSQANQRWHELSVGRAARRNSPSRTRPRRPRSASTSRSTRIEGLLRVYDPRAFHAGRRGFCRRLVEAAAADPASREGGDRPRLGLLPPGIRSVARRRPRPMADAVHRRGPAGRRDFVRRRSTAGGGAGRRDGPPSPRIGPPKASRRGRRSRRSPGGSDSAIRPSRTSDRGCPGWRTRPGRDRRDGKVPRLRRGPARSPSIIAPGARSPDRLVDAVERALPAGEAGPSLRRTRSLRRPASGGEIAGRDAVSGACGTWPWPAAPSP